MAGYTAGLPSLAAARTHDAATVEPMRERIDSVCFQWADGNPLQVTLATSARRSITVGNRQENFPATWGLAIRVAAGDNEAAESFLSMLPDLRPTWTEALVTGASSEGGA